MISNLSEKRGISPVIAVLLMVGITVVIAGVAAIWVLSYTNTGNGDSDDDIFIMNVNLDGTNDEVTFSIVSGAILNTSKMVLRLENSVIDVPVEEMNAGSEMTLDAGMDLTPGDYYTVKITVDNKLFYDNELVAAP